MAYFTEAFLRFYEELAANNHRDWFQANKERYENHVKQPFRLFVRDLIERVQAFDPSIMIEPKDAVFRVNRDIRFSKDKSPYKLHAAASLTPDVRKSRYPGYYVHFGPQDGVILGGGGYFIAKEDIPTVQNAIIQNPQRFEAIIYHWQFYNTFGTILGERYKKPPKGHEQLWERLPMINNKQFYFASESWPVETILSEDFLEQVAQTLEVLAPFNRFLREALVGTPKAESR